MGKGGIDVTPSDFRQAPAPPTHLLELVENLGSPESLSKSNSPVPSDAVESEAPTTKLLPRETGEDIGMGSPVPLSQQAVDVISKLRNMKVSQPSSSWAPCTASKSYANRFCPPP